MFNKPTSDLIPTQHRPKASLLNKRSSLAPALGVTNLHLPELPFWSHFVVLLKSDLDVNKPRSSHIMLNSSLLGTRGEITKPVINE